MTRPRTMNKYWTGNNGQEFEVLVVWNPNEEPDPWVRYRNILEDREHTCRLEAFTSRFRPIPD
jgi:hypothetical protein